MRTTGWSRHLSALTLLLWATCSGDARGQSVDTSMARATIDQPLSMTVQVRGFDWPASHLTPECLQVQVRQGESGEAITPLRLRTVPAGDDGRVLVQVSSPQKVVDTVLTGRFSLLCGADFTREFTVLADPPTTPQRSERSEPAPRPPSAPTPRAAVTTSARHATDTGETGRSAPPPAHRVLEEAEVQQLVTAVVTALAQAQPPATPAPSTSPDTSPTAPLWLDLREEQRQTHASLTALQARLDRSAHDRWRDAALVIGMAIALAVSRLLLQVLQESLMPRLMMGDSTAPIRRRNPHPLKHRDTQPMPPEPTSRAPIAARTPEADTDAETFDLHDGFMQWSAPTSPPGHGHPAPPAECQPAQRHWPDADFGYPSLDTTVASTDLLQELEPHTADFPIGVAVVLERRLQALPGKCPWILLRLLGLYRQMAQPWNHDRVAAQLEALYNVRVPDMEAGPPLAVADLDAFPDTLDRIKQAWQQEDPTDDLATLLLKPATVECLTLPAFEDVLLLHGIALQRQTVRIAAVSTPSMPLSAPLHRDRLLDLLAA